MFPQDQHTEAVSRGGQGFKSHSYTNLVTYKNFPGGACFENMKAS